MLEYTMQHQLSWTLEWVNRLSLVSRVKWEMKATRSGDAFVIKGISSSDWPEMCRKDRSEIDSPRQPASVASNSANRDLQFQCNQNICTRIISTKKYHTGHPCGPKVELFWWDCQTSTHQMSHQMSCHSCHDTQSNLVQFFLPLKTKTIVSISKKTLEIKILLIREKEIFNGTLFLSDRLLQVPI